MKKKRIYVSPQLELNRLADVELMENWQSGIIEKGQDDVSARGKKHQWNSWNDDVQDVGSSAGTGNSPLELPSGGKLWGD